MSTVLITGGAGYIGSHTVKMLANDGVRLVVLDNLSMGHRWAAQDRPMVAGDLSDRQLVRQVIEKHDVESVIHFAASAYVGESTSNPRKYFQNNVVNTLSLLDAMQDCGVRRIVFSSTCATYGVPSKLPMDEQCAQTPINPYGESKLFIERAMQWYESAYGMQWVALRYFNAAGADPDGELGEEHTPETHIIPLAIQAALGWRSRFQVYGTDYPTADGTAVRDYIHVTDLATAHLSALRHLLGGGGSDVFNLGTGRGHSVREIIDRTEWILGRKVPVENHARRAGDPPELVADPSKARRVLRWSPKYSDLDTIVGTAANWFASAREKVIPGAERLGHAPKAAHAVA